MQLLVLPFFVLGLILSNIPLVFAKGAHIFSRRRSLVVISIFSLLYLSMVYTNITTPEEIQPLLSPSQLKAQEQTQVLKHILKIQPNYLPAQVSLYEMQGINGFFISDNPDNPTSTLLQQAQEQDPRLFNQEYFNSKTSQWIEISND